MVETSLDIKIACQSNIIPGAAAIDDHPWRNWRIRLVAMDAGKEQKGKLTHILDRVEYILHPTFANPRRVATCEPYMLQEKGWGEFDLRIVLYFVDNLVPPEVISFDLNFRASSYSVIHKRFFQDAPPEFLSILGKQSASPIIPNKRSSPYIGGKSNNNSYNPYHRTTIGMTPGLTAGPSLSSTSSTHSLSPSSSSQQQQGFPSSSHHSPIIYDSSLQYVTSDLSTIQKDDRPKRGRYGRSGTTTSNNTINNNNYNDPALFNKTSGKKKEGLLMDDIYTEQDLEHVHPIHRSKLELATRQAWGLPANLDMMELATRLSRMNDDQADEFQYILQHSAHKDTIIEDTEDEIVVDLYSLGPQLLNTLWLFTERINSNSSLINKEEENTLNGYNGILDS
ncbi:yeats family-domain-containing protein [Chlamydoabsidia padenii]|nr:yeats family-domain-containing protein [Chlamydoabsidia padenii]